MIRTRAALGAIRWT